MNIYLEVYLDNKEAKLVDLAYHGGAGPDMISFKQFEEITKITNTISGGWVAMLQNLLDAYNKPVKEPTPEPDPALNVNKAHPEITSAPAPAPEPEPVKEEPKPVTMEEVRAVLIEVRKTKGTDVLKTCFDAVGAARLTDVDAKDYEKLLAKAKEVLNAK